MNVGGRNDLIRIVNEVADQLDAFDGFTTYSSPATTEKARNLMEVRGDVGQ